MLSRYEWWLSSISRLEHIPGAGPRPRPVVHRPLPGRLLLTGGAPLLPVGLSFLPDGRHGIHIRPPLPTERQGRLRDDVVRVTQQLAAVFEELIRAAPDQWLMMQPNWPSDRL